MKIKIGDIVGTKINNDLFCIKVSEIIDTENYYKSKMYIGLQTDFMGTPISKFDYAISEEDVEYIKIKDDEVKETI